MSANAFRAISLPKAEKIFWKKIKDAVLSRERRDTAWRHVISRDPFSSPAFSFTSMMLMQIMR